MKFKALSLIVILSGCIHLVGQDCNNFHQDNCFKAEMDFQKSDQSVNIEVTPDEFIDIFLVAQDGEEYFISFCTEKKNKPVHFMIYDMNNPTKVLYDNSYDKYNQYISFDNKNTRKLKIVAAVKKGKKDPEGIKVCLGFSVEHKKLK
ncbi:MAG: hypothetical protein MI922_11470 [Bacteroidales bacterium]|nr:hypothetical protein [Bacteroidales bacterium]